MKIFHIRLILAGILMAVGLAGCSGGRGGQTSDASLTLRTYSVPQGNAAAVSSILNSVLSLYASKQEVGKTWAPGPNQILVLAPAGMQDSIASSITQIAAQDPSTTSAKALQLNTWLVDVYSGQGTLDPRLKPIQSALQDFESNVGPAHFVQSQYFSAVSDVGTEAHISPQPPYGFTYTITNGRGGLGLRFFLSGPQSVSGQVTTQLGRSLVLGLMSGWQAIRPRRVNARIGVANSEQAEPSYRLLVIRVEPASQG